MNRSEASALVASLKAAFPDANVPPETVAMYAAALEDLDATVATDAVGVLIRRSRWFPKIAEIREEAAERTLGCPSASAAWERLTEYADRRRKHETLTDLERRALDALGGTWAIRTSEAPSVMRSQFLKLYDEMRRDAIGREMAGSLRVEIDAGRLELAS